KSFAMGETMAHINYLEAEGKVHKKAEDNRICYSLA
ncbi:MBL fold metallo-hydrolase, partial [Thermodesulfobacteriota bacterium]